jgi:hypothetical protein
MNFIDPMYKDVSDLLCSFEPITLLEMENVKLLDRIDTKFIFNYNRLAIILDNIKEHYKVLNVNGVKQSRYETLYFDTNNFKLYHDHHNGHSRRYKVRYRKYVDSDIVFFEVKYKNNKGRTIKSRINLQSINNVIEGKASKLLKEKTLLVPESLESKLWVNYSRITLVNKISPERLTLDINLQFKKEENEIFYHNLVIAEVKQEKLRPSPFLKVMKKNKVREGGISKYCIGVVALVSNIKKNNFKLNLLTLNKLSHETSI